MKISNRKSPEERKKVFSFLFPALKSLFHRIRGGKLFSMLHALFAFFLPRQCPLCGGVPADGTGNMFCADCLKKLHFVRTPACPGCGGELSGILELCPDCLHSPGKRPWEKALSVFVMEGAVKEVIYLFKYRNRPSLARPLGMLCAQSLLHSGIRPDVMTYTPLHWTRCLRRGYNQSELLVREMAKHVPWGVERLLKRRRLTRQQAHLGRKERILNMRGAFRAVHPERFRGKKVLLVDDVLTTGATLSSASEELLKNGASQVFILVLARRSTDFS